MCWASPSWRFASGREGGRSEKGAQVEALGGTLGGENTAGRQAGREGACSRSRRQGERQRRGGRRGKEGQIGERGRQATPALTTETPKAE